MLIKISVGKGDDFDLKWQNKRSLGETHSSGPKATCISMDKMDWRLWRNFIGSVECLCELALLKYRSHKNGKLLI